MKDSISVDEFEIDFVIGISLCISLQIFKYKFHYVLVWKFLYKLNEPMRSDDVYRFSNMAVSQLPACCEFDDVALSEVALLFVCQILQRYSAGLTIMIVVLREGAFAARGPPPTAIFTTLIWRVNFEKTFTNNNEIRMRPKIFRCFRFRTNFVELTPFDNS